MERVQTFSQTLFPLPNGLTREDLGALRRAARLVAGERLPVGRGTANATFALANPEVFDKELTNDQFAVAFTDDSYTESIAGVDIPLDPRRWRSPQPRLPTDASYFRQAAGAVGGGLVRCW